MATIEEAVEEGLIEPFPVPSWDKRQPIRPLWVAYELWDWIEGKGELHDIALGTGHRTIFEHLEQSFSDFRCDERFYSTDLRRMMPNVKGVRSFHSYGIRIYGWCPLKHSFVAIAGALEQDTKKNKKLNDEKRDEVLAFIKLHGLEHTVLNGDNRAVFPPNN